MVGLRISTSIVTLAVLVAVTLVFTAYTLSAYYVASYVYEMDGMLMWHDTLGGSFFPWPHKPTGFVYGFPTECDQEDYLYYNYVIRSGVLVVITLLLWSIVIWRIWKMRAIFRRLLKKINNLSFLDTPRKE